eukprot:m.137827 g.137827  ORF g.137827 m.137827 type:complete len:163 (-) comp20246_c9_seq2:47-535(-)
MRCWVLFFCYCQLLSPCRMNFWPSFLGCTQLYSCTFPTSRGLSNCFPSWFKTYFMLPICSLEFGQPLQVVEVCFFYLLAFVSFHSTIFIVPLVQFLFFFKFFGWLQSALPEDEAVCVTRFLQQCQRDRQTLHWPPEEMTALARFLPQASAALQTELNLMLQH